MTYSSKSVTQPMPPAPLAADRPLQGVRQPLYLSLARSLMQDIDKGRYPVGSSLPPEDSLAQRYGVSRHTVRQALRELKDDGVVWSRAGVGTIVRARTETPRFFSGIKTVSDLLQFVEATEMHVIERGEVVADSALAAQLYCPVGQAWTEITILRKVPQQKLPLSYLQVYLRTEYADAVGPQKVFRQPIYSMVEARFGVRIVEVRQEITAANLTRDDGARAEGAGRPGRDAHRAVLPGPHRRDRRSRHRTLPQRALYAALPVSGPERRRRRDARWLKPGCAGRC